VGNRRLQTSSKRMADLIPLIQPTLRASSCLPRIRSVTAVCGRIVGNDYGMELVAFHGESQAWGAPLATSGVWVVELGKSA